MRTLRLDLSVLCLLELLFPQISPRGNFSEATQWSSTMIIRIWSIRSDFIKECSYKLTSVWYLLTVKEIKLISCARQLGISSSTFRNLSKLGIKLREYWFVKRKLCWKAGMLKLALWGGWRTWNWDGNTLWRECMSTIMTICKTKLAHEPFDSGIAPICDCVTEILFS